MAGVAPLSLALLTPGEVGGSELELARALLLLVCLAQIGGAMASLLGVGAGASERAVAGLAFAAVAGWTLATALGSVGLLQPSLFLGLTALAAFALRLAASSRRGETSASERSSATRAGRVAFTVAAALSAAVLAHDLHVARFLPPGGIFYDDVSYHLPAAVLWRQSGDLRMLRFAFGDPSTPFYPIAGELTSWILLAGFEGSDFLARWSQLPAAVGLLFAVWALAKRTGASAWGALVAVLMTLSVPRLYSELALSAGNDVWAAFFALCALLAARHAAEARGAARLVPIAVALGALAATKYLALLWFPWLILTALLCGAGPSPRALRPLERLRLVAAPALALLVAAGFSYARNAATTGNPVFPQPLTIAGWGLLPGWEAAGLAERLQHERWGAWDLGAFVREPALLGPLWSRALLASALLLPVAAAAAWRRRTAPPQARFRLLVALGPLWLIGIYAGALHDHRDIRYAIAAIPLAAVAFASLGAELPPRWRWPLGGVSVVLSLWTIWGFRAGATEAAALAALVAAGVAWLSAGRRLAGLLLATIGGLLLALDSGSTLRRYEVGWSRFEPAAVALERLTGGRGATVAYVGGNRPYYLHGARLRNRVEIVPTHGSVELRHYRWGAPIEPDPFAGGSRRAWFERMRQLGIEHVIVDSAGETTRAGSWLMRKGSPWLRVEAGEGWQIFSRRRAVAFDPPVPETRQPAAIR